ncbi:MAG TPA: LarC family nickel insertion protein [Planctomycetota bacterium]|nr:LarC family nickel insertion protein [Planctomycetota bacterium]
MSTLLIEMPSGIAGDMLLAGLLDLGADLLRIQQDLLALGVGPIHIAAKRVRPSGIAAVQVDVVAEQEAAWEQRMSTAHDHHHHGHSHAGGHEHGHTHEHPPQLSLTSAAPTAAVHRPYRVIRDLLTAAPLPEQMKKRAQRVFRTLAKAEAQVHSTAINDIEFHEVGALDAIADVVGCCLALEQLSVDHVIAMALLPGNGSVRCAHGRMPVPVPAVTAMLARTGAPHRQIAEDTGELTTPTGCALVTALADEYLRPGHALDLTTSRVGYGAGHKVIPGLVNAVRVSLVEQAGTTRDQVCELRCQVDDSTGEQLAVLVADLMTAGAKDAYLTPVLMKKGRPGYELTVLCAPNEREALTSLVLTRSSTIGVRHHLLDRTVLHRRQASVSVHGHEIPLKIVTLPDGSERAKPEADVVLSVARALGLPFDEVQREALAAWDDER